MSAVVKAVTTYDLPLGVFDIGFMNKVGIATVMFTMEKLKIGKDEFAKAATNAGGSFLGQNLVRVWGIYSSMKYALARFKKIYYFYNPKYDDVPLIMVDAVNTENGSKYVKYDVVRGVWAKNGEYPVVELNAFEGKRWNALYYTKSSDAGEPLLAEFDVSNTTNRPEAGYRPVHLFGEVICYDLNKYNFSVNSEMIFLSIERSHGANKGTVEAPRVAGTIFGAGFVLLSGGVGVIIGMGGTVGVQKLFRRKKKM